MNTQVVSLRKHSKTRHAAIYKGDRGHIEIDRVSISFGVGKDRHHAVNETTLQIEPGEFACLLGPSGCGKSTLLNSIAGYVKPTTGAVFVDGEVIHEPGPDRGMVFQQYSLFPWKTIRDNIAFGPMIAGKSRLECSSIANTFLEMVGLTNRHQISGRTVRWHAAARRDCAGARQLSERVVDGRTVRRARRPDPAHDAGEPVEIMERVRDHGRVRYP